MKLFMNQDFLLNTETAKHLYHTYTKSLPIIDYHCHIPAREIAEDVTFENITRAWLAADHYKWRAMRACGVEEDLITGVASDKEKFLAYASCMPKLIGNPLYHWTHLELQRYFDIYTVLGPDTAEAIWEESSLKAPKMSARSLMKMSNVKLICTTDDPVDNLKYHAEIANDDIFDISVYPAFRPDRAIAIEKTDFLSYIQQLGEASNVEIKEFDDLTKALRIRLDYFQQHGCKASDHGLSKVPMMNGTLEMAITAFEKRMNGQALSTDEEDAYRAELLRRLAEEYYRRGWVMEIHYGVLRNTRTAMFERLGADSGFDNMGADNYIHNITQLLNQLDARGTLPKILIFSINPAENGPLCTLCGAFGSRVQQGASWWFNDTLYGMKEQLNCYSSLLPIGNFVGFLTDSRSFLSYPRHEYFRRILCRWVGEKVENGEFPNDETALKNIIEGISYTNTKNYFS